MLKLVAAESSSNGKVAVYKYENGGLARHVPKTTPHRWMIPTKL